MRILYTKNFVYNILLKKDSIRFAKKSYICYAHNMCKLSTFWNVDI